MRANVATGTFGAWDETGRYTHLALLAGGIRNEGYGRSLGRFILEDGLTLPPTSELEQQLRAEPGHPLAPARAELLQTMVAHQLASGRLEVKHPNKATSLLAQACRLNVPLTVHPGIGYDIIAVHPLSTARRLDGPLSGISPNSPNPGHVGPRRGAFRGTAIMAPQVFERA